MTRITLILLLGTSIFISSSVLAGYSAERGGYRGDSHGDYDRHYRKHHYTQNGRHHSKRHDRRHNRHYNKHYNRHYNGPMRNAHRWLHGVGYGYRGLTIAYQPYYRNEYPRHYRH